MSQLLSMFQLPNLSMYHLIVFRCIFLHICIFSWFYLCICVGVFNISVTFGFVMLCKYCKKVKFQSKLGKSGIEFTSQIWILLRDFMFETKAVKCKHKIIERRHNKEHLNVAVYSNGSGFILEIEHIINFLWF